MSFDALPLYTFTLIYSMQTLKMTKSVAADGLNGRVINLMSTDVAHFDYSMYFVHLLWKGPIELAIFGYLIYLEIGFYGWIGLGFILCFVPMQCKFALTLACMSAWLHAWCDSEIDVLISFAFTRHETNWFACVQYGWAKWRPRIACGRPNAPTSEWKSWMKLFKAYKWSKCMRGRCHLPS